MKHLMLALFTIGLLAACGSSGPSNSDIRKAFDREAEVPAWVEITDFTLDQKRNVGSDDSPVWQARITIKMAPREPTFVIDTVEDGVRILKQVSAAGETVTGYLTVKSEPSGDGWRHRFSSDGANAPDVGRLRSEYGADALVAGTPEADALLTEIKRKREEARIAEETRIAAEAAEQKRKEEAEAAKRKRIEEAVAKHGAGFAPQTLYHVVRELKEGQKRRFLATASASGGDVYGTDLYGGSSDFSRSLVHSGVLRDGETGIVEITKFDKWESSPGSPRNGIDSKTDGRRVIGYTVQLLERIPNE